MKTTIGGDRLGSGNKMELSYKNYERSTHDLSYLWRSSMAAGPLVPFMNQLALPGDNLSIELNTEVLTLPTIGPLFGSYKVQLDVFEVPLRLYNAKLHMNKLGIGMDMKNIFLPQIRLRTNNNAAYVQTFQDNEQVNPSSLVKYLGISGLGRISGETNPATRDFNACPFLAYWDIYKNYYSNKQEEVGYMILSNETNFTASATPLWATITNEGNNIYPFFDSPNERDVIEGDTLIIQYPSNCPFIDNPHLIPIQQDGGLGQLGDLFHNIVYDRTLQQVRGSAMDNATDCYIRNDTFTDNLPSVDMIGITEFDLKNIDDMREDILQYSGAGSFIIDNTTALPYSGPMQAFGIGSSIRYAMQFSQCSLGLKTYQSDLFNNWINTEWIDGENGVSALTAIDTSGGEFTIDALNIAQKVYVMLNRIAISGGTYDDWLDAVYTHERVKGVESPIYHGSLIKELAFQEVISNSASEDEPLGTLAGRGKLTDKHKGGYINIKVNEPSIIMGIVSITPRIEYSQGNDWTVNLKTYDDFHKPALDAIGFQDLITEQLLWTETTLDSATSAITTKSLGKQPAWLNYMTNVNKVYGAFAEENNSMFMVLNRRYEADSTTGELLDGTTYIDPSKFNHIFADTSLDSQNFWVQISCDIKARRKMSAKVIPNL